LQEKFCVDIFCNNNIQANHRIETWNIYGNIMRKPMGHVKDNNRRKKKKLLDLTREILRRKHYNIRTEEAYIGWILLFANSFTLIPIAL